MSTQSDGYTNRLETLSGASWKRLAPNPYRRWIRGLGLGTVLDVGCGIGRTLEFLDGNGVGIDHNPTSIEACRERGLTAYLPDAFATSPHAVEGQFDALIMLHVLEHLDPGVDDELLSTYLPYVRPHGRVVLVTPQERGFASDPTHIEFIDNKALDKLCAQHDLNVLSNRSFPLPRRAGKLFVYNEFTVVAEKRG